MKVQILLLIFDLWLVQINNREKDNEEKAGNGKMLTKKQRYRRFICLAFCVIILAALMLPLNADSLTDRTEVYIGGTLFGTSMMTDGVPIVSIDGVDTEDGVKAPAYDAGLKVKDIIKEINGVRVTSSAEVTSFITKSEGKPLSITVLRGEKNKTLSMTPAKGRDGTYRAGIWIRDNAAGIGTVTYIIPETLEFGGLGHGICDGETMSLMPLLRGSVSEVEPLGIIKGKSGVPGEIKGAFKGGKIGALTKNMSTGVYGLFSSLPENIGEKISVAKENEICEGEAQIRSSVTGKPEYYTVKISKLNTHAENGKNFTVEVTDKRLISVTGGIVQGMSGSPIVQNGRLIGAVTHVMINEPTKGYGIFIENMLSSAQLPQARAS